MKLSPLANRVVFEEIDATDPKRGSLWIPDVARKNKAVSYGKVIAVGPGRHTADGKLIPCAVKENDVIMYPTKAPAVLTLVDAQGVEKDFLMCPDNDIIGTLDEMPRVTQISGLDGALLSITPQSLARPDSAYKNIAEIDEARSDLRQSGAPEDVIAELDEHQDEED